MDMFYILGIKNGIIEPVVVADLPNSSAMLHPAMLHTIMALLS